MNNPVLTRHATFLANSYNPEDRTFTAVIATPTPVMRRDAAGPFAEILPPEAFDLTAQTLPVLDSHNTASVRAILGQTLSIRREGDSIVADMRLSSAEDVAPIGQRIADGTLSGVSIGYRVAGWATRREAGQRIKSASRVHLAEVTLTSNPADPNAGVRQAKEGGMPKDVQEQQDDRAALIARVRAAHNLPEEWATRMAEAEDELSDDEIRADGRETALAARAARPQVQIRTATPSSEDPAVIRDRQVDALSARMMGTAPADAARPFMQMGLQDFARDALVRAGQSVATLGREELLTRAMHTVSDFPELLTGAGNRVLANAYQQAQSPLKQLARQRTAADFRPLSTLKLGEFSGLQKVTEAGEIKSITTGEAKESYSLETFGGIFSLSRKAIINDDLGAFARWGEMMGRAAAETETAQLLGLLLANAGAGVLLDDGLPLFHADHGNVATTPGPLELTATADPLSDARLALRKQKGLDGVTPVNVVPKYLLVSPENETNAEKILTAIQAVATADVNAMAGRLQVLVEPRLTGLGWYVFGDPATAPVLEYAYLSSAQGPQLSSRDGWETLGREFRVVLDFGAGVTDHRGAYRNAGA
ncbi:prohead protease/major capsid protein fusion protein [Paracoccus yeei]|uniref:prohead protease/major capsid protein fusion protein n=1 Tax=Paracoccus yeei TaxID=147645 RepID=UPI000490CA51|nr:prohead protease/major capsid protein fusion protein [Paracoccus yeei]OWJ97145.1 peptidase [Paracoccus yeei]